MLDEDGAGVAGTLLVMDIDMATTPELLPARQVPAFLSPRDTTHARPKLPSGGMIPGVRGRDLQQQKLPRTPSRGRMHAPEEDEDKDEAPFPAGIAQRKISPVAAYLVPLSPLSAARRKRYESGEESELDLETMQNYSFQEATCLRDLARAVETDRKLAVDEANLDLAARILRSVPYYDHKKFETSYQVLMAEQRAFSATLRWDKDPAAGC